MARPTSHRIIAGNPLVHTPIRGSVCDTAACRIAATTHFNILINKGIRIVAYFLPKKFFKKYDVLRLLDKKS